MTIKNLLVVHHTVRNWEDLSKNRKSDTDFLLYDNTTTSADISGHCFKANGDLDISNVAFVWDNNAPQKFPFLPDGLQIKPFLSSQFQTFFGTDLSNVPYVDLISGSLNHKIHFNDISDCYNSGGGTGSIRYDLDNTYWEETGKLRLKQKFDASGANQIFNVIGQEIDIHDTYFQAGKLVKKPFGSPISPFSVICRDGILYGCGDFHYIIRGHDDNFKYKFWQDISSQFTPLSLTIKETHVEDQITVKGSAFAPILSYDYSKYHIAFIDASENMFIVSDVSGGYMGASSDDTVGNEIQNSTLRGKNFVYVTCGPRLTIAIAETRDGSGNRTETEGYLWGFVGSKVSDTSNKLDAIPSWKFINSSYPGNKLQPISGAINSTHYAVIDTSHCLFVKSILNASGERRDEDSNNSSLLDLSLSKVDFLDGTVKYITMDETYLYVLTNKKGLYEIKLELGIIEGNQIEVSDARVRSVSSLSDVPGEIIDFKRHYNIIYVVNEFGNLITIDTSNSDLVNLMPFANTDLSNTKFQSLKGNEGQLFLLTNDISGIVGTTITSVEGGREIYAIGNNLQGKLGLPNKDISNVFFSDVSRNIVVAENLFQSGFETFPEAPVKTLYSHETYVEDFNYLYERIFHSSRAKFDGDVSGIRQTPLSNTFLLAQSIGNIMKSEKTDTRIFFNDYTYSDYTYEDASGITQINPTFGGEFYIESTFEKCTIETKGGGPTDVSNVIVIVNYLSFSDISGLFIENSDISSNASSLKDLSGNDILSGIQTIPFTGISGYNVDGSNENINFTKSVLGVTVSESDALKATQELNARSESINQKKLKDALIEKF